MSFNLSVHPRYIQVERFSNACQCWNQRSHLFGLLRSNCIKSSQRSYLFGLLASILPSRLRWGLLPWDQICQLFLQAVATAVASGFPVGAWAWVSCSMASPKNVRIPFSRWYKTKQSNTLRVARHYVTFYHPNVTPYNHVTPVTL